MLRLAPRELLVGRFKPFERPPSPHLVDGVAALLAPLVMDAEA